MNDDTCKLFDRVAKKMGWTDNGGLDTAERKVCCALIVYGNTSSVIFIFWKMNYIIKNKLWIFVRRKSVYILLVLQQFVDYLATNIYERQLLEIEKKH